MSDFFTYRAEFLKDLVESEDYDDWDEIETQKDLSKIKKECKDSIDTLFEMISDQLKYKPSERTTTIRRLYNEEFMQGDFRLITKSIFHCLADVNKILERKSSEYIAKNLLSAKPKAKNDNTIT